MILTTLFRSKLTRYRANFADKWLINTHNGYRNKDGKRVKPIDTNQFPPIKSHLDHYWKKIEPRSDQGVTPYNLRNCAYLEAFEEEKVVWKRIGSVIRFSYSDNGDYSLDSTVIMTGDKVKYLTAILNSKLMIRELLNNSPKTGTGDVIISVQALNPLPVVDPDERTEKIFNDLVDTILHKMENGEDTANEEEIIDLMVYKLYHLTYEEACIVDPDIPFTIDEYEKANLVANIY